MKNTLPAKIRARNRLHDSIKLLSPHILEALKPLVGQKIILATGELSAKAKTILNPFLATTPNLLIYRYHSKYSLVYIFKVDESIPDGYGCVYQEQSVYFGAIQPDSGILEKLYDFDPNNFKSDFKEEEIIQTRQQIGELEKQISNLKSKISYFGEYD